MSGVATAIAGGAIVGGIIQGSAAQSAANTEANAANNASAVQMNMFNTEQANEAPYMAAGTQALGEVQANMPTYNQPFTMSQFKEDPGYQFDLQQGESALQNSAAASGHMVSSQQLGNASNYAQSMASNEFGNAFNRYQTTNQNNYARLMGLVGVGQAGASNTNAAGANAANNISANTIGAGNASAAAQIGTANAISSGISGSAQAIGSYNMFNGLNQNAAMQTPGYAGTAAAINGMNTNAFTMPSMGSEYGGGSSMASLLP
jgi:hypothetical protein